MKLPKITSFVSILSALFILAACSAGDGDNLASSPSAENGRVSLLITDAPSVEFDQINLTLESISFIPADKDDSLAVEGESAKETIVFDQSRVINLLALQNFSDLLATTMVPVGSYSKIRLHVSQVELVNLNPDGTVAESFIAKLPANGKIDLNPQGSFDVTGDGHLMMELDVDAEKAVHIIEKGKKLEYNFRPVIFVNILGEDELKLVILDGKVLEKTESGFQLCKTDAVEVDEKCLAVMLSTDTVVQDELIDKVAADAIKDNGFVTVLGKASAKNTDALHIDALHVVLSAADKSALNQALFTGVATSAVDIDQNFGMKTDDDNPPVLPDTLLTVTIADGARIFDKYGNIAANNVIANGVDVDVFGMAIPDLATVSEVKAAFVIYDDKEASDNFSGTIADIYLSESKLSVTVNDGVTTVNECVAIADATILLLKIVGDDIVRKEITINELKIGMLVDIYGVNDGSGCMPANVVLVIDSVL